MAEHKVEDLAHGAVDGGSHDVRPRDHHLPNQRVPELEDGVDELLLTLLDDLLLRGHLRHGPDLLLGDEGALRQALSRHDHVGELDKELGNGADGHGDPHDDGSQPEGHPVRVLDGERLRSHLREDEQQDGHCSGGHPLTDLVEVTDRHHGRQRGATEQDEQREQQHDVQVLSRALGDADHGPGPPTPFVSEVIGPDTVHPRDGGLRGRQDPGQEDQAADRGDLEPVQGAERRNHGWPPSRTPE